MNEFNIIFSNSSTSDENSHLKKVINKPKVNTQRLFDNTKILKYHNSQIKANRAPNEIVTLEGLTKTSLHKFLHNPQKNKKGDKQGSATKPEEDSELFLKEIVGIDENEDLDEDIYAFPPIKNKELSEGYGSIDSEILEAYSKFSTPWFN